MKCIIFSLIIKIEEYNLDWIHTELSLWYRKLPLFLCICAAVSTFSSFSHLSISKWKPMWQTSLCACQGIHLICFLKPGSHTCPLGTFFFFLSTILCSFFPGWRTPSPSHCVCVCVSPYVLFFSAKQGRKKIWAINLSFPQDLMSYE